MKGIKQQKTFIFGLLIMILTVCVGSTVQVEAAKKKVYLSKTSVTLYVGQSKTLKVKNTKKAVKWSSSKKKVATVSGKGRIVAKKKGTTTITAKVGKKKYKCKVVVQNPKLSQSEITLNVNEAYRLLALGTKEKVKWTAKNPEVIRVSKKGNVRGLKIGTTYVIAWAGKYKMKCKVTVDDPVLGKTSALMENGTSCQLSLLQTKRPAQWSSSNPAVASVSGNGVVSAKERGTAVITAKVGTKTLSCSVSVMGSKSSFKSIAHRGYRPQEDSGHCRLSAYVDAKNHGFNYGEVDVQFTLDGEPVCCHDATFQDGTTGETIVIAEHTLEELKTYNYHGESIASLEELMSLCRSIGMGLYIDKTTNIAKKNSRVLRVFEIIRKYGMQNQVTFLITTQNQANKILAQNPGASLSVLMSAKRNLQTCATIANAVKTAQNTVSIDCSYHYVTIEQLLACKSTLNPGITFEACTVNSASAYKNLLPYVEGITSDKWSLNDYL